jgi:hypothetical protein
MKLNDQLPLSARLQSPLKISICKIRRLLSLHYTGSRAKGLVHMRGDPMAYARLFALLLVSISAFAAGASSIAQEQKTWLSHANRYEKNGWIYLHIEGEPRVRGY